MGHYGIEVLYHISNKNSAVLSSWSAFCQEHGHLDEAITTILNGYIATCSYLRQNRLNHAF